MKLFLERKDVKPDSCDSQARTPLLWAAMTGCEGMAKLLLERNDVNPSSADNGGQTPLMWATKKQHEGVVELLLERLSINSKTTEEPNEKTLFPATSLSGNTPVLGTIPNQSTDDNPKRKSHTLSKMTPWIP